jgi:AcrR family transcriptional regulator
MREDRRLHRGERYRKTRREAIINKAIRIFARQGYERSSMDEIADRARVAKGTLYYYFPSKEELYHAVMLQNVRELFGEYEAALKDVKSPFEFFQCVLKVTFDVFSSKPDVLALFVPFLNGEIQPSEPRVKELLKEIRGFHAKHFQPYYAQVLKANPGVRGEAILFLAQAVIQSVIIGLYRGEKDRLKNVMADILITLQEGLKSA